MLKHPITLAATIETGYLAELENAIRLRYRSNATHRQTIFVQEKTADNKTVWFGDVEMFDLTGCKDSKICYAWQSVEDGVRIVTVLHNRLVDSARRAVQAASFSGIQSPLVTLENDVMILKQRTARAKKALHDAQIKTEDLETILKAVRQTHEPTFRKW